MENMTEWLKQMMPQRKKKRTVKISEARRLVYEEEIEKLIDLDDVTYYVGHETVIAREDGNGMPAWQERFFAVMERNAVHVSDFFSLPTDQVVEIGRQIAI